MLQRGLATCRLVTVLAAHRQDALPFGDVGIVRSLGMIHPYQVQWSPLRGLSRLGQRHSLGLVGHLLEEVQLLVVCRPAIAVTVLDRKSTRLNSSHVAI